MSEGEAKWKPVKGLGSFENDKIIRGEILGGMKVVDLPVGKTLFLRTDNRVYRLERRADGLYLSGHPEHCPEPTPVTIHGSTFGGSMIKAGYIGRGMELEYHIVGRSPREIVTTSQIGDIEIIGEEREKSEEDL